MRMSALLAGDIAADLHDLGAARILTCSQNAAIIYQPALFDEIHVIRAGLRVSDEVRSDMDVRILVVGRNEDIFPLKYSIALIVEIVFDVLPYVVDIDR